MPWVGSVVSGRAALHSRGSTDKRSRMGNKEFNVAAFAGRHVDIRIYDRVIHDYFTKQEQRVVWQVDKSDLSAVVFVFLGPRLGLNSRAPIERPPM